MSIDGLLSKFSCEINVNYCPITSAKLIQKSINQIL